MLNWINTKNIKSVEFFFSKRSSYCSHSIESWRWLWAIICIRWNSAVIFPTQTVTILFQIYVCSQRVASNNKHYWVTSCSNQGNCQAAIKIICSCIVNLQGEMQGINIWVFLFSCGIHFYVTIIKQTWKVKMWDLLLTWRILSKGRSIPETSAGPPLRTLFT